jgi:NADPH:quinone reductase-like Zn-dependent oxidoreductase
VIAVTGAAGAVGGYVTQLGKADGLTVVADAAEKDRDLVRRLGADRVVQRGDGFADGVLRAAPGGVDGLVDAAVTDAGMVRAVADGGRIALVRGGGGADDIQQAAARRGIETRYVVVHDYDGQWAILDALRQQADAGVLTLRVAKTLPLERAADAHRELAAGGIRGRIVLTL